MLDNTANADDDRDDDDDLQAGFAFTSSKAGKSKKNADMKNGADLRCACASTACHLVCLHSQTPLNEISGAHTTPGRMLS